MDQLTLCDVLLLSFPLNTDKEMCVCRCVSAGSVTEATCWYLFLYTSVSITLSGWSTPHLARLPDFTITITSSALLL